MLGPTRAGPDHAAGPATPTSSFVGREAQLEAVDRLLATNRLVTLTGPGGCGKTRLAQAVAARRAGSFRDGVAWVALAPLHEPGQVAPAVEQALGV